MVTVRVLDSIALHSLPLDPMQVQHSGPGQEVTSFLKLGEIGIIISLSSHDAKSAYVIGPHGGGWTYGACLQRIDQ
jgi:hypothetical protein